jgi:hypothetical protein
MTSICILSNLSSEVQLMRVSHPSVESTTNCTCNLSRPRNHKSLVGNNMMFYLIDMKLHLNLQG